MKRILLTAVAVGCLSMPAFAWSDGTTNNNSQHQRQLQGQHQAIYFDPTISTVANGGVGGTSSSAGGGYIGGASFSSNHHAPDVFVPSVGGGGSKCPVVGFGIGGSGPGAGGGFGPTWYSTDCATIELAHTLDGFGYPDVSVQLLKDHFSEVKQAFDEVQHPEQQEHHRDFFSRLFGGNDPAPAVEQSSYEEEMTTVPPSSGPKMTKAECHAAMRNHHLTGPSALYVQEQCG